MQPHSDLDSDLESDLLQDELLAVDADLASTSSDHEGNGQDWGTHPNAYYDNDDARTFGDPSAARAEEQQARRIQKEQHARLSRRDFLGDEELRDMPVVRPRTSQKVWKGRQERLEELKAKFAAVVSDGSVSRREALLGMNIAYAIWVVEAFGEQNNDEGELEMLETHPVWEKICAISEAVRREKVRRKKASSGKEDESWQELAGEDRRARSREKVQMGTLSEDVLNRDKKRSAVEMDVDPKDEGEAVNLHEEEEAVDSDEGPLSDLNGALDSALQSEDDGGSNESEESPCPSPAKANPLKPLLKSIDKRAKKNRQKELKTTFRDGADFIPVARATGATTSDADGSQASTTTGLKNEKVRRRGESARGPERFKKATQRVATCRPKQLLDETPVGKRNPPRAILKNQPVDMLRAAGKSSGRNPRVRQKRRYDKAVKRRRTMGVQYQGPPAGAYAGEGTGVRRNVVRSVKL